MTFGVSDIISTSDRQQLIAVGVIAPDLISYMLPTGIDTALTFSQLSLVVLVLRVPYVYLILF